MNKHKDDRRNNCHLSLESAWRVFSELETSLLQLYYFLRQGTMDRVYLKGAICNEAG